MKWNYRDVNGENFHFFSVSIPLFFSQASRGSKEQTQFCCYQLRTVYEVTFSFREGLQIEILCSIDHKNAVPSVATHPYPSAKQNPQLKR